MHDYLTAHEVADLLRIKERKLYDLVSDGAIPVTKVTGKLLFPRAAVMEWMREHTEPGANVTAASSFVANSTPLIMAGSHDPLLDWALRASGAGIATWFDGSADGIARMKAGQALAAGIHFHGEGGFANAKKLQSEMGREPVVLIEWAKRQQGLVTASRNDISTLRDLKGKRFISRQTGAGSRVLFELLLREAGLSPDTFQFVEETARSENEVAQAVSNGRAEAGFAIEAAARQFGLDFIPLATERFDLVVWRREYFETPFQKLLSFANSNDFAIRASELGGYDVSATGEVHFNGP